MMVNGRERSGTLLYNYYVYLCMDIYKDISALSNNN